MPTIDHPYGFLKYRPGSGDSLEIYDIHVESEERRTGIGRALVARLIKVAEQHNLKRIYAITRAENRIAQEWYEALKFRPIPLYDFYGMLTVEKRHTVDAIMYVRDLEQYP